MTPFHARSGRLGAGEEVLTSDEIRTFQRALIARGYDIGPSGADGILGAPTSTTSRTRAAIRAFQQTRGITAPGQSGYGLLGPRTQVALAETVTPPAAPGASVTVTAGRTTATIEAPSVPGASPAATSPAPSALTGTRPSLSTVVATGTLTSDDPSATQRLAADVPTLAWGLLGLGVLSVLVVVVVSARRRSGP